MASKLETQIEQLKKELDRYLAWKCETPNHPTLDGGIIRVTATWYDGNWACCYEKPKSTTPVSTIADEPA